MQAIHDFFIVWYSQSCTLADGVEESSSSQCGLGYTLFASVKHPGISFASNCQNLGVFQQVKNKVWNSHTVAYNLALKEVYYEVMQRAMKDLNYKQKKKSLSQRLCTEEF